VSIAKFYKQYTLQNNFDDDSQGIEKLDCPFCDKEGHFFVNMSNGLYECKKCGEVGNQRTFMTVLHATYLDYTEDAHYQSLSEARNISPAIFKRARWAYDIWNERWLVPYANGGEFLCNLGYFYPNSQNEKFRYRILKATGIELYLYNPFCTIGKNVYICEGEWDALALQQILKTKDAILAAPGATTFKTEFAKTLTPAESITLLYDNDSPGLKGMYRASTKLSGKQVNILDWTLIPSDTNCTDIRDFLTHKIPKPATLINNAIVPLDTANVPTEQSRSAGYVLSMESVEPITDLKEYMYKLRKVLYVSKETEKAIIATLAVAISTAIDGEMIWAFLVGPPSCGKTTFIESFGGTNEMFDYVSKMTSEALVSGYRTEDGSDGSLLPLLNNKTAFCKDFTVTLSMPSEAQHKIFGLLRDIYDGTVKVPFGNGLTRIYQGIRFNLIAGVTDAIHGHNDAELGERFLRIDYMGHAYNEDSILDKALDQVGRKAKNKDALTHATLGFVKHIMSQYAVDDIPEFTPDIKHRIKCFAKLVARVRTKPKNDRSDGLVYKPRPEVATRLALQMSKLLIALSRVFGEKEITENSMAILKKVTLDSCYGFVFDVLYQIHKNPEIDKAGLIRNLNLPSSRITRVLSDLTAVRLVRIVEVNNESGHRGRNKHTFTLQPTIKELFDALQEH
jgi:ribosomal protein L37AE/L43A